VYKFASKPNSNVPIIFHQFKSAPLFNNESETYVVRYADFFYFFRLTKVKFINRYKESFNFDPFVKNRNSPSLTDSNTTSHCIHCLFFYNCRKQEERVLYFQTNTFIVLLNKSKICLSNESAQFFIIGIKQIYYQFIPHFLKTMGMNTD
jgi:hypothetical protein